MKNSKWLVLSLGTFAVGIVVGHLLWGNHSSSGKKKAVSLSKGSGTCSAHEENSSEGALLSLDGKIYTDESLPEDLKNALYQYESEKFSVKKGIIEEFAVRIALAQKQSVKYDKNNVPPFIELIPSVKGSDGELKKIFEANKKRFPKGTSFEQAKPRLAQVFERKQMRKTFTEEIEALESSKRIQLLVNPPVAPAVNIDTAGFPYKGDKNSKNVLVEASDYMCGHCQNIHPEVKKLIATMGDRIKFVQMNFALKPNGQSGTMIQGAYCAQKQGSDYFWKYHNLAFDKLSNEKHDHKSHGAGGHVEDKSKFLEKAKDIAKLTKLDIKKFESCINSKDTLDYVLKTNDMLSRLGVTGTPTFFLNGKKLSLKENLLKTVESAMEI